MENYIKIILIVLFALCLLPMPYEFYMLVRFLALVGFAILAYKEHETGRSELAIVYGGLALLFQPFLKIPLGREIWNLVDVMAIIFLAIQMRKNYK